LETSTQTPKSVCIIGAGIVGLSAALYLQRDGHRVTIFDGRDPGSATSFGNAGAIVTCAVEPTSTPGVLKHIPRYLLDPRSAVRIRWRYLPRIAPWLVRFLLESRPQRVQRASAGLYGLVRDAGAAHRELAGWTGGSDLLREAGWLKVFRTRRGFEDTRLQRELMDLHGIGYDVMEPRDLADLEPRLAPVFVKGLFHRGSLAVSLPKRLLDRYAAHLIERGASIERKMIDALSIVDGGVEVARTDERSRFDLVVVAAGAWSDTFCRQVGDRVVLDTERGYHLNLDADAFSLLSRPVSLPEHSFVLAPMQDGLRLTSGEEFAGVDAPPDYSRIRRLLPIVREVLPSAGSDVTREWMGRRPSTPDSLPVIGRSPRAPQVIYAFGHQHLGVTLGPVTGRIVAGLVRGAEPDRNLRPYRIERF
jgi:D-amino-acid dehydrogenase